MSDCADQPQASGQPGGGLPPGLELQDASRLTGPGRKPGEVIVVAEGASYVAYSWDAYKYVPAANQHGCWPQGPFQALTFLQM